MNVCKTSTQRFEKGCLACLDCDRQFASSRIFWRFVQAAGTCASTLQGPDGISLAPRLSPLFSVVLGSVAHEASAAGEQVELQFPLVLPSLSLMGRLKHATAASFYPPAMSQTEVPSHQLGPAPASQAATGAAATGQAG